MNQEIREKIQELCTKYRINTNPSSEVIHLLVDIIEGMSRDIESLEQKNRDLNKYES